MRCHSSRNANEANKHRGSVDPQLPNKLLLKREITFSKINRLYHQSLPSSEDIALPMRLFIKTLRSWYKHGLQLPAVLRSRHKNELFSPLNP